MMVTAYYDTKYLPQIQDLVDLLKDIDPKSWCLAGGACRKYFENKHMNHDKNDLLGDTDFDVFVFNKETYIKVDSLLSRTHHPGSFTLNLSKFKSIKHPIKKIDLIFNPSYRSAAEVIEGFDLRCCQCFFQNGIFMYIQGFLDDILSQKLVITNIKRPYGVLNRLMRYSKKGYNLTEESAESFFDYIRIMNDDYFDYGFSISDPNSFSYQHYEELNNEATQF